MWNPPSLQPAPRLSSLFISCFIELPSRRINGAGHSVCRVEQLRGDREDEIGALRGWYYDDSSDAVMRDCPAAPQRIVFTPGAEPVPGARVVLECSDRAACP